MGYIPHFCAHFTVQNASPREVYFQALRLEKKIDRLNNEMTGTKENGYQAMHTEAKSIAPKDVYVVVRRINRKIDRILAHINLKVTAEQQTASINTKPSDVYNKLIVLNEFVNALLDKRANASDVYETTMLSIFYLDEILLHLSPDLKIEPKVQKYTNKTIIDVIEQQIIIIQKLKKIAKKNDLKMLDIQAIKNCKKPPDLNELQELSYLILSEVEYLARIKHISLSHIQTYYPGKRYLSDIYQRNEVLIYKLEMLMKQFNVKH